jgi:hypothetical protein
MPCIRSFHRYVYRRFEQLTAGTAYHFQTNNLRNVFIFQSAPADPVMYIVDQNRNIVAFNDDYSGLASEIFYTPTSTGLYTLVIRSFNTDRPGYCDLYRGVGGAALNLVERDVLYFGVRHDRQWNQGDVFETGNSGGDPYLLVITPSSSVGSKMYFGPGIDDAGAGLNSRFVAPTAGSGLVILGSYSRTTEGDCDLCQDPSEGAISLTSSASGSERMYIPGSREMQRFSGELKESKETLEALEPVERDRRIGELQQRILSEEERRLQSMPVPQTTPDAVRLVDSYLDRCKELEPELESLSNTERSERLAELKRRMVGPS